MIKILDCTLRDGGYYNSWKFNKKFVEKYLLALSKNNINTVELGFRFLIKDKLKGPYAFTNEYYINSLDLPKNLNYSVMINADDYINDHTLINKYFLNKKKSKIGLVRIAINFTNAHLGRQITIELKKLGYKVGLNLMQPHNKSDQEYRNIAQEIYSWKTVDILYFADSLGCLNPNEVVNIALNLKKHWKKELGFHAHDNRYLALANSLKAIESKKVTYIDCTMTGMGRGAGNLQTEVILSELDKLSKNNLKLTLFLESLKEFQDLKKKFNWGSNLFYQFAAKNLIHPSYIQNLLSDNRYNTQEINQIIKKLGRNKSNSFSLDKLNTIIFSTSKKKVLDLQDLQAKEILLIGNGISVNNNKVKIKKFIKEKNNLKTFFLNINQYLPNSLAFGTIVSHPSRIMFDMEKYMKLKSFLIMPTNTIVNNNKLNRTTKLINYNLMIEKNNFISNKDFCKIPNSLVLGYALAFMIQLNVKKIYTIGIDGFEDETKKNNEINQILNLFKKKFPQINIKSLTKTRLKIKYQNLMR